MTVQTNKKRKHESSSQNSDDDQIITVDQNIETVLFEEMTCVNSQLIGLASKVKLVDSRYFMHNSTMIDEFIANIYVFLEQVDIHRRKVSSKALNSDNLFNIFQFLDPRSLINGCRYVSTLWKEVSDKMDLSLSVGRNIESLVKSPTIRNVTTLKLRDTVVGSYQALAKRNVDWTKLTSLDISGQNLIMTSAKHLAKCNMPNLTELNLSSLKKFTKNEAEVLFKSKLLTGIKKLDVARNCTAMEACQTLNQITHLTCSDYAYSYNSMLSLEPIVKDKTELESLSAYHLKYSSIITSGSYTMLSCLQLGYCAVPKKEFVSLIICKNLPNLRTFSFIDHTDIFDHSIIDFPPNSQSSITRLTLWDFNMKQFPALIDHCPNLKSLAISVYQEKVEEVLLNYLNSTSLSKLEKLEIRSAWPEVLKIIFTNPTFSNLKELDLEMLEDFKLDPLLVECTNLKSLRKIISDRTIMVSSECEESLKTHSILSNVELLVRIDEDEMSDESSE